MFCLILLNLRWSLVEPGVLCDNRDWSQFWVHTKITLITGIHQWKKMLTVDPCMSLLSFSHFSDKDGEKYRVRRSGRRGVEAPMPSIGFHPSGEKTCSDIRKSLHFFLYVINMCAEVKSWNNIRLMNKGRCAVKENVQALVQWHSQLILQQHPIWNQFFLAAPLRIFPLMALELSIIPGFSFHIGDLDKVPGFGPLSSSCCGYFRSELVDGNLLSISPLPIKSAFQIKQFNLKTCLEISRWQKKRKEIIRLDQNRKLAGKYSWKII